MINKETIRIGFHEGAIKLVQDPNQIESSNGPGTITAGSE